MISGNIGTPILRLLLNPVYTKLYISIMSFNKLFELCKTVYNSCRKFLKMKNDKTTQKLATTI